MPGLQEHNDNDCTPSSSTTNNFSSLHASNAVDVMSHATDAIAETISGPFPPSQRIPKSTTSARGRSGRARGVGFGGRESGFALNLHAAAGGAASTRGNGMKMASAANSAAADGGCDPSLSVLSSQRGGRGGSIGSSRRGGHVGISGFPRTIPCRDGSNQGTTEHKNPTTRKKGWPRKQSPSTEENADGDGAFETLSHTPSTNSTESRSHSKMESSKGEKKEENGSTACPSLRKRKRGRPRGSTNKPKLTLAGVDEVSVASTVARAGVTFHRPNIVTDTDSDDKKQELVQTTRDSGSFACPEEPTWERMFFELVLFKSKQGHVMVPSAYEDQHLLGRWVQNQRCQFKQMQQDRQEQQLNTSSSVEDGSSGGGGNNDSCSGSASGGDVSPVHHSSSKHGKAKMELNDDRVAVLRTVGFVFGVREEKWESQYQKLVDYKKEHGHCNIPTNKSELGRWVNEQRLAYTETYGLPDEFKKEEGGGDGEDENPREEGPDGIRGGRRTRERGKYWGKNRRGNGRLTEERRSKLDAIGFVWRIKAFTSWDARLEELRAYRDLNGHCNVPQHYAENRPLGKWVTKQRYHYNLKQRGKPHQLNDERIEALEQMGFCFDAQTSTGARKSKHASSQKDVAAPDGTVDIGATVPASSALNGAAEQQLPILQEGSVSLPDRGPTPVPVVQQDERPLPPDGCQFPSPTAAAASASFPDPTGVFNAMAAQQPLQELSPPPQLQAHSQPQRAPAAAGSIYPQTRISNGVLPPTPVHDFARDYIEYQHQFNTM